MKRILLLSALALTACAPGLLPGGSKQDPTPPTLTKAVLFTPGTVDRTLNTLTLYGLAISVNDPDHCKADSETQATCTYNVKVPALSAGFALPAKGVMVVKAAYTNPDGSSFTLFAD